MIPKKEYRLTLSKKSWLTRDVILLEFQSESSNPVTFSPGQFLVVKLPSDNGHVFRSYSLFSTPSSRGDVCFLVRLVHGPGSQAFSQMRVGDAVEARGPVGNFMLVDGPTTEVFIATGTGFAPIHSMLKHRAEQDYPSKRHLVFGTRFKEDLFLGNVKTGFDQNLSITETLSRPGPKWKGETGYVTAHLNKFPIGNVRYYICGSQAMINDVKTALKERGVPDGIVLHERFY